MPTSPERAKYDHHTCQDCGIQLQTPMVGIYEWAVELKGNSFLFTFIGIIWRGWTREVRVSGEDGADRHWGSYQYTTSSFQ